MLPVLDRDLGERLEPLGSGVGARTKHILALNLLAEMRKHVWQLLDRKPQVARVDQRFTLDHFQRAPHLREHAFQPPLNIHLLRVDLPPQKHRFDRVPGVADRGNKRGDDAQIRN